MKSEPFTMTSRRAWLLVGFLGGALFLNNSDCHTVFSLFPVLKSELHFTDVQLGLTGSIFLWVYAICNPISGQIGDRYSKRRLVALSLFLWSGVTALNGLSNSAWMLLACRGLLGITESLFMPSAMALLATAHGPSTRSLAANLFGIGEYAGVAKGGWFGGFMAQEVYWRLAFLCLGLAGMLYTIPYLAFLKRIGEVPPAENKRKGNHLSITVLAKVPTCRFICMIFPICFCVFWLLYTWLPLGRGKLLCLFQKQTSSPLKTSAYKRIEVEEGLL
jgi:MFS family permease